MIDNITRQNSVSKNPLHQPIFLLRLEGAALLIGGLVAAYTLSPNIWLLLLFVSLPDVTLPIFLVAKPNIGAIFYNFVHTTTLALTLLGIGLGLNIPVLTLAGVAFLIHIGFDRMIGAGIKYPDAFGHTHLSDPR